MRWLVAASLALAAPAAAHVAPAIGDNNRYLKLTPLGDRVRLAYTIFYGEVPGRALRAQIDANHDGAIDDRETEAFGERIARDVARAVVVAIDGVPAPVAWSQVVVGLATPKTAAGAFSIDLVASLCLTRPRGPHAILLRDAYPLDRPGETEVKLEDSPGVTITRSRIGGAEDEAHDYKLVGPSGALETEGLDAQLVISDKAPVTADATCAAPAARPPTALIVGAGVVIAFVLAVIAILVHRHRSRR